MNNESLSRQEGGVNAMPCPSPERPLVSVVIPTYKRAHLLRKAIISALAQEQAGELFEMEIIVVDDCSPDETAKVVAEFPRVQYLRLDQNRGASGARNAGIKRAKGKYIALLDDDDEFLTHKLMVQVPILEAHPEIGVLYGQSVVTGGETPLLLWPQWGPSGNVFEEFVTTTDDFLHPPTWLVRRELFEQAGFFDESKAGMEHYDMALRIAALTPWMFLSGGPVARGRYSQQGLWYSTIVNGTNEQQLPKIIEAALLRLPATADADRVRRKARAAVCASIAHQRWWAGGGLEPTKAHLLKAVREAPWLLQEAAVVEWLKRIASTLAGSSSHPVAAVKKFWKEITNAVAEAETIYTGSLRRLFGELLEAAAISMKRGSPRRAPLVAVSALLNDPSSWMQPARLYSLYRAWTRESLATAEHAKVSP
ncbi:MAG: glycosyltransferase [Nitrospira sp.]|nr:glycosyltransferase [Nitrospira sp.]MCW5795422.1 glycosyltransferase family 2 protein [Nitrospira sp.]HMW84510.1 glycosyltransferase family 2 protein [Nitrospira sp.]